MMVCFVNQKGGVGKSTLAAHAVMWAAERGIKTALLDCDNQRSSSVWISEAMPGIEIRIGTTPEKCLSEARGLAINHDLVIADGPAGLSDVTRAMTILSDLAILPLTPSVLDIRSIQEASEMLRFAQGINGGKPDARIVLNKMRPRESISRELLAASASLGIPVAKSVIRDLQAYRDAAGQATSVSFLGRRGKPAADDIRALYEELLGDRLNEWKQNKEVMNG